MRKILIVIALAGAVTLAGCGSTKTEQSAPDTTAAATTSTPAATAPTQPFNDRVSACEEAFNAAGQNVKALLANAQDTLVSAGTPAAAATKWRADAAATREIVENARTKCHALLPECPTSADAYLDWLKAQTAAVDDLADTILGAPGSPPTSATPAPSVDCHKS